MNFDFGEVLTRAWQITWKHKVLWVISLLPFLMALLFFPVWLVLAFQRNFDFDKLSVWMQNPVLIAVVIVIYLVFIVINVFLQVASRSSVTFGVYRAELAIQPIAFVDLLKNGLQYFWRILGVSLLVGVGITVVFFSFFACLVALSIVTMGMAAFCLQPLILLMIPFIWLVMAFIEQSELAIVADGMNITNSVKQAYELIKANIWKYLLITIIIYLGMGLLTSLVTFPFMIPMFFFMMSNLDANPDFTDMIRIQAILGSVILPLLAVIQGFSLTYMKSAMMLVYLHLTRSQASNVPVLLEANA